MASTPVLVSLAHLPPLEEKAEIVSFYLNTAVHFIPFELQSPGNIIGISSAKQNRSSNLDTLLNISCFDQTQFFFFPIISLNINSLECQMPKARHLVIRSFKCLEEGL